MTKTLAIEVKTVTLNVTVLARRAGLPETVIGTLALQRFAEAIADTVMQQQCGAVPAGTNESEN